MLPSALKFGAALSDRVEFGAAASLLTLDPVTWVAWANANTLTSGRRIMAKAVSGQSFSLRLNNGTGDLRFDRTRAGGQSDLRTNSSPLVLNQWVFVAATWSSATSPVAHIYTGTLLTPATEASYGTNNDSSGAVTSDAAGPMCVGNLPTTNDVAFQGLIAGAGVANVILTLEQIRSLQAFLRPLVGTVLCASPLARNGTGLVHDDSGLGNHGTITGAVPTSDVLPRVQWRPVARKAA